MYKELSKEAKKNLIKKYEMTKKGKSMSANLNRLVFEGIFCLFAFIVILIAMFVADLAWWYWFFTGLTLICGILFLVGQHLIRMKEYNNFLKHMNKNEKNLLTKIK